ncbi:tRNA (cytosine(38)-C(5))-methyltransferase [Prorops nasuta]|uniref:tRNA (cytosine(38)-C(5))-methyltransferase n=1 Tax=Prorops nasuta TaxID=863751 RepID=UPI0034CD99B5
MFCLNAKLFVLKEMNILELYSGIGGMHFALRESRVKGNICTAIDINTVAGEVYKYNFPDVPMWNRNIQSMNINDLRKLNINCILMSPPCQPFTRTGLLKDQEDERTASLFHILKLIPQLETLQYVLLENVKGFENSNSRHEVVKCLKSSEFNYTELILSPCQFGIPNSRHRYYLVAKKKSLKFVLTSSVLLTSLPENIMKLIPKSTHYQLLDKDKLRNTNGGKKCFKIKHILELNDDQPSYLIPQKILQKHINVLDIRNSEDDGSCCFTKAYRHYNEGTGSVYCPLPKDIYATKIEESKKVDKSSYECLKILESLKLRYFTPTEISRLMCFPEDFTFPNNITVKQRYRLLGNSINVYVVSVLIFLLNIDKADKQCIN